jgi:DNA-binding LytR/AlgR family response regulator
MNLKAIIIEDDISWRTNFRIMLDDLGISVIGMATTVAEAVDLLEKHTPDIILADVLLDNELVFEVFDANYKFCKIPTIFITQSQREIHYEQANKVMISLFLIKPIHKLSLKSAIETLCSFNTKETLVSPAKKMVLRGKYNQKIELPLEKIVFINQDLHYCTIHTSNQQFVQKKSLVNLMKELDDRFMQIHRSHCVNIDFIDNFGVGLETLKLKTAELPIGLTYKDDLKKLIAEKYSVK